MDMQQQEASATATARDRRPVPKKLEGPFAHRILDNLLEGCQLIDRDWRYVYLNGAAVAHSRKRHEELIGRTMMEAYPGIEKTAVFAVLRRCMRERTNANLENEFTHRDGSTGWFELRIQPVPEGLFVLSLDISSRKEAERATQHRLDRLRSLRAIDLVILGTTDLRLVLRTVVDETRKRLEVDAAAVFLFDPATSRLEAEASTGFQRPEAVHAREQLGRGATGRAGLERRKVVLRELADGDGERELPAALSSEGLRAWCAAPLVAKGELLGVLALGHRAPLDAAAEWLDFFDSLADQAAIAISGGKSFEEGQRARQELTLAYDTTIEGWSRALDLRDKETEGHTLRVTEMTVQLARMAGMTDKQLVHVRRGALLHDIGKMGVPDPILLKPDKLTEDEWEIMRKHPTYAYELLSPIEYLRPALDIPYCHHEKWDGTGYPRGLAGEQIPLAARLFAAPDVWDALRSDRPYRSAWPEEKVIEHIRGISGSHLEPRVVELFLRLIRERGYKDCGSAA